MQFKSLDAFLAARALHGETLGSDIANYTDVQPVIQFREPLTFA